eukprot:TRINITY_DN12044_c0_g1_i3.p1 TRINITY_DN12044_c0_g1~~TRINITY_DN12044_c0_g1_i3.p1  ORF type:complete len:331 (+),score=83.34 TRINITY_DN12044_c0_g1_i3:73-993(+)
MADPKEYSRLKDGHYKITGNWYKVLLVEGEAATAIGTIIGDIPVAIEYGEFGEADPKISETTGQSTYNAEVTVTNDGATFKERGVITENGVKLTTKSMMGICEYEWITEEEAAELQADGDPIDAPPAPYKLQPENQGRLLWFTGPPGLGKSTSAQLLARNHGYVYYEADCFVRYKNPYIPVDVPDPSMAQWNQTPLEGEGLERRKEVSEKFMKEFGSFLRGDYDKDVFVEFYELLCQDIIRERQRIGGDWVIASCVVTQDIRNIIRSQLGPDLMFVSLEIGQENQMERIGRRHNGNEAAMDLMKVP